jgi:hypothetical protein
MEHRECLSRRRVSQVPKIYFDERPDDVKPSGGFAVLLKQKVPEIFVSLEKKGLLFL